MLLSPSSAEKVSKIRVKSQKPLPSYRMDRNDDELDAMMVSVVVCHFQFFFLLLNRRAPLYFHWTDILIDRWVARATPSPLKMPSHDYAPMM